MLRLKFIPLGFVICLAAASAAGSGDWVTFIRPVDLRSKHGGTTRLTPGTCARVLELDGQNAFVSLGKLGYVDRPAIVSLQDGLERFSKAIGDNPGDALRVVRTSEDLLPAARHG